MKKALFALLALCFTPFAYAAYGSVIYSDNKDEDNAIRMVSNIQDYYEQAPSFKYLEKIPLQEFWRYTYDPSPHEILKNFEVKAQDDDQVAVIKYAVKDCDSLKDIKEKLISYKIIKHTDYVDCFNNQFVAEITKEKMEGVLHEDDEEELAQEEEQDELTS